MKFSIIIPAHDTGKYIGKCLDSVYSQSYKDFECIVVCDSCTDNTREVAEKYNPIIIDAEVHNEGVARNLALDICKGEWVLFIDSDDWWIHEFVFEQLAKRIENNNADAIVFDMVWKHIGVVGGISGRDNQLYPHCTNKCWRRSFIADTRFPNIKPDSDAGFHKEIMKKNPKFDMWDMPMYYYNFLRDDSYSKILGRTAQMAIDWWRIK